tara:strand:- start:519 stop:1367 length:849 start_codon:yes stop_codon:yes gene_type:complete
MTKARDFADIAGAVSGGKIASTDVNVSFENINDTGTEGTKIAAGTTGQRGSTEGQIRYNTTTNLTEYYNGNQFLSVSSPPEVTSVDVTEIDSQAGGNQTIVITGSNFDSSATALFLGQSGTDITPSTVTRNSATQITTTTARSSFLNAQEPYDIKVTNGSGLSGILTAQINVDTGVAWTTAAGTLGDFDSASSVSTTVAATDVDGDTIAFSLVSGALPTGLSLNSSTGAITGTAPTVTSATTFNFTLRATANTKTADRAFSMQIIFGNYYGDGSDGALDTTP